MFPYLRVHPSRLLVAAMAVVVLTGCEIPGIWPDPRIAQREEESKAIGGACRHALRGLEDCYTLNPKASKAAVFAGWKEMDAYMRENKLEGAPRSLTATKNPRRRARQPLAPATRADPPKPPHSGAARPGLAVALSRPAQARSNTAMLSTCAVCGNMLTMPAATQR